MTETLDVVARAVENHAGARLEHRDDGTRRAVDGCRNRRNGVDRVERQNRCVIVIEDAIVIDRMVRSAVYRCMAMDQEMVVTVVLRLMDVFRRGEGKPTHRHRQRESDKAPEH